MSESRIHWDCIQFEADVEKKVSHRKMLGNMTTAKHSSEVHISEQFFIFGIPPNAKKDSQKTILIAYPPTQLPHIPISNILLLSNPNIDMSNTSSKMMLSNIFPLIDINGPVSTNNGIVDEFVFQYNAGVTKIYGICVHVQPSKASKLASSPFYSSENTKKSQFCFCMLSKIPIFNAHFTFLHYLVGISCGTIPLSENIKPRPITDLDTDINMDSLFEGLEIKGLFAQNSQLDIPDEFKYVIIDHFSKTLFSSPTKLSPNHIIHFPPPTTQAPKLILYGSLDTLFSILSISDIVELLTALLLDAQVLIIGSSMQEVSMTVYGLYSLLTPFNYCGVVMPILPNNEDYLNLLNSPTPYIYGMQNIAKLRKMSFLESTYIVNLDKRKKSATSFFPKYPNFKDVVKKITDLIKSQNDNDTPLDKNKNTVNEVKQTRLKPAFSIITPKKSSPVPEETIDNKNQSNDNSDQLKQIKSPVIININTDDDKKQQQSLTAKSDELHEFPTFEKKTIFPEIINDSNPYRFPVEFTKKLNHKILLSIETINKILDILHEPLDFIFTDTLNGYFVTNAIENITIFNQALFLASVKKEDLSFYEFLLESQTFQDYVENKLDQFTRSKCVDPSQRRRSTFGPKSRKRASTVRKIIKGID